MAHIPVHNLHTKSDGPSSMTILLYDNAFMIPSKRPDIHSATSPSLWGLGLGFRRDGGIHPFSSPCIIRNKTSYHWCSIPTLLADDQEGKPGALNPKPEPYTPGL